MTRSDLEVIRNPAFHAFCRVRWKNGENGNEADLPLISLGFYPDFLIGPDVWTSQVSWFWSLQVPIRTGKRHKSYMAYLLMFMGSWSSEGLGLFFSFNLCFLYTPRNNSKLGWREHGQETLVLMVERNARCMTTPNHECIYWYPLVSLNDIECIKLENHNKYKFGKFGKSSLNHAINPLMNHPYHASQALHF